MSNETSEARTAPPPAVGEIHALRQPQSTAQEAGPLTTETSQGGHPGCEGSGSQAVLLRTAGMLSLERRCMEPGAYVGKCVAMSKYPQGFCVED